MPEINYEVPQSGLSEFVGGLASHRHGRLNAYFGEHNYLVFCECIKTIVIIKTSSRRENGIKA